MPGFIIYFFSTDCYLIPFMICVCVCVCVCLSFLVGKCFVSEYFVGAVVVALIDGRVRAYRCRISRPLGALRAPTDRQWLA